MKGNLEIHSENILPIIKKWLYSDRDIFVRELVSNACDACEKLRLLNVQGPFGVDVRQNKEAGTIEFEDNGIGMTAEEVKKYIAQIAFSGAEEFVQHYKSNIEGDQLIGHFGLGFYSSYMVAKIVEIETLSYQEGATPVFWHCDGSIDYEITEGTREKRGTLVRLILNEEDKEYLEEARLEQILKKYCKFLTVPIRLNGKEINTQEPLWIKNPKDCTQEDYLNFYRYLYPNVEDPLFWIHLNVDYPFNLKGILYFPRVKDLMWEKYYVQLFCNRVFVADNCKDILPEYLTTLRGVIDSPDIPLNVSRSFLQHDRTVRLLTTHISKKVSDTLNQLLKDDREKYIGYWEDIGPVIKLGILQDEKFLERVKDILIFKSIEGVVFTLPEYQAKHSGKIYYTKEAHLGKEIIKMYQQQGIDVLVMDSPFDPYVVNHLESKIPGMKFQRIDAGVDENLIDKEKEKTVLDAEGKTEQTRIAEFFQQNLGTIHVEAKSLAGTHLPGVAIFKEEERRTRDAIKVREPNSPILQFIKPTFIVNTNNPLIESIYKLASKDPELSKDLAQEVYDLSLLEQKEMDSEMVSAFIERSHKVLSKLLEAVQK